MPMSNDLTDRSEAILNMYVFKNFIGVRKRTDDWMREYNEEWPHDALNNRTPLGLFSKILTTGKRQLTLHLK